MKKIFTTALVKRTGGAHLVKVAVLAAVFLLAGCAFSDYGVRVNEERSTLESLERQREDYQGRYVIVLNSLERNIGDRDLEKERDRIQKKILDLDFQIKEQRKIFDESVEEWEQKIAEDKLQKQINDREEQTSSDKAGSQWDSNR